MKQPPAILSRTRSWSVALVGNPNTGKSTLFTALTGFRQHVGNYPGTTVEKRKGLLRTDDPEHRRIELVDLPGAYSLATHARDEALVLDVLLGHQKQAARPDAIVVVVDASNLFRNLFLTTQVLELGRPVIVALNMIDVAEAKGIQVDVAALSSELGTPVVPVVATRQRGIDALRRAIVESLRATASTRCAEFPASVEVELEGLRASIASASNGNGYAASPVEALQILLDPGGYHEERLLQHCGPAMAEELAHRRRRIQETGESVSEVEAQVRYAWIHQLLERIQGNAGQRRRSRSELVDRIVTQPVLGLLILLVMMGICFQSVYAWAAPLMDGIDGALAGLGALVGSWMSEGAMQSLVQNGIVAGVGAVLTFLPQILILFLFIAILEDCGYMARAAFLLDRWMGLIGLNGKSFIPLLSSFACAVPGIMATRTIEDRKDRFVTVLIAPLMSCSARLPVYTLMIGAFIPAVPLFGGLIGLQAITLIAMYFVGIVVAIPVAMILQRTILKGEQQAFLLEMPSYKWPSPRTVIYRVYEQGREFCVSAGTIIFAVTVIVWAMGYYPHPTSIAANHDSQRAEAQRVHAERLASVQAADSSAEAQTEALQRQLEKRLGELDRSESGAYLRHSVLGRLGRWIEPVVEPLGWDWRIGTAAIASFPAREVVIATMGTIYNLGGDQDETSVGLRDRLHAATWPDGRPVFSIAVALSIMVFFALCCQCGATLATIKRETHAWRWPLLTFTYMTALAYVGALATYQVASRLL